MVAKTESKTTTKKVKLFKNGASQAVRLPAEFRFEGSEIYATRDNETGVVTLSEKPLVDWRDEFFALVDQIDPNDPEMLRYDQYMAERPLNKIFKLRSVLDLEGEDGEREDK